MKNAVHIENLCVYYGNTPALEMVNINVSKGEYLGIIGPNGGGKSTLLKVLLGLVPPSLGKVTVFGHNPAQHRARIGYVPQSLSVDRQFPISVLETVLCGRLGKRLSPFFHYTKADKDFAISLLEKVGLAALTNRHISDLSGGEFQKMLIARALAVEPALLLLDEPTANVDAASREQIYSLLGKLNKNMTIILVTHDLLAISSEVRSLACLNCRLTYHGEPFLSENIVSSMYGYRVDLISHGIPHRVLCVHNENNGETKIQ